MFHRKTLNTSIAHPGSLLYQIKWQPGKQYQPGSRSSRKMAAHCQSHPYISHFRCFPTVAQVPFCHVWWDKSLFPSKTPNLNRRTHTGNPRKMVSNSQKKNINYYITILSYTVQGKKLAHGQKKTKKIAPITSQVNMALQRSFCSFLWFLTSTGTRLTATKRPCTLIIRLGGRSFVVRHSPAAYGAQLRLWRAPKVGKRHRVNRAGWWKCIGFTVGQFASFSRNAHKLHVDLKMMLVASLEPTRTGATWQWRNHLR